MRLGSLSFSGHIEKAEYERCSAFSYETARTVFNSLLEKLGTSREEQFPGKFYCSKEITLSKAQVRRVIGTWSASPYHTMPLSELVDDIICKVEDREYGRYEYHSNANPNGKGLDYVYVLVVDAAGSYLYDVINDKYFTFKGAW